VRDPSESRQRACKEPRERRARQAGLSGGQAGGRAGGLHLTGGSRRAQAQAALARRADRPTRGRPVLPPRAARCLRAACRLPNSHSPILRFSEPPPPPRAPPRHAPAGGGQGEARAFGRDGAQHGAGTRPSETDPSCTRCLASGGMALPVTRCLVSGGMAASVLAHQTDPSSHELASRCCIAA
jgi:hypothetical protein